MTGPEAAEIKFGNDPPGGRDGSKGWYYAKKTGTLHINSDEGGADLP